MSRLKENIRLLPFLGDGAEAFVYGPVSKDALKGLLGEDSVCRLRDRTRYVVRMYRKIPDLQKKIPLIREVLRLFSADRELKALFSNYFILPITFLLDEGEIIGEIQRYGGRPLKTVLREKKTVLMPEELSGAVDFAVAVLRCGLFLIDNGIYLSDIKLENAVMDTESTSAISLIDLVFNRTIDRPAVITRAPDTWPEQMAALFGLRADPESSSLRTLLSGLVQPTGVERVFTSPRERVHDLLNVYRFYLVHNVIFMLVASLPVPHQRRWSLFRRDLTNIVVEILSIRTGLNWHRLLDDLTALRSSIFSVRHQPVSPRGNRIVPLQSTADQRQQQRLWEQTDRSWFRRLFLPRDCFVPAALLRAYTRNTRNASVDGFEAFLVRNGMQRLSEERRKRIRDTMVDTDASGKDTGTGS